jgi:microcystin-dependent protein
MGATMIGRSGSGKAHDNRQPYLGLNYVIALQGIFPSRN